jgi:hypothetical protein
VPVPRKVRERAAMKSEGLHSAFWSIEQLRVDR